MTTWMCVNCDIAVEEQEIETVYLEVVSYSDALVCPGCGEIWLSEASASVVATAEAEAESKMA